MSLHLAHNIATFKHLSSAHSPGRMNFDIEQITRYPLGQLNILCKAPAGDRGLKRNANRWDTGTVPPTVKVRTPPCWN